MIDTPVKTSLTREVLADANLDPEAGKIAVGTSRLLKKSSMYPV